MMSRDVILVNDLTVPCIILELFCFTRVLLQLCLPRNENSGTTQVQWRRSGGRCKGQGRGGHSHTPLGSMEDGIGMGGYICCHRDGRTVVLDTVTRQEREAASEWDERLWGGPLRRVNNIRAAVGVIGNHALATFLLGFFSQVRWNEMIHELEMLRSN